MTQPITFTDQAGNVLDWNPKRTGRKGGFTPNTYRILADGATAEIDISRGRRCLVDVEDLPKVLQYRWYLGGHKPEWSYARAHTYRGDTRVTVQMHRIILETPEYMLTDHINGDRLDNRKENLRISTNAENSRNRSAQTSKTYTRFKGVMFADDKPRSKPWYSVICANGKYRYLGNFHTDEEAARVYDDAARRLHGPFARLNFHDEVAS